MIHKCERRFRRAAPVFLLLVLAAPRADAEVELYRAQNRAAEELAPLAAELLEPAGTAFADPGTGILILKGPAEAVREALELVRTLDVPLASYRIETILTTRGELLALGASAEGWLELGDLHVFRSRTPELSVSLVSLFDRTQSRFHAQVSVRQGHRAHIWTGTVIAPRVHVFRDEEDDEVETRVFTTTPALSLRSGLSVRPRGRSDGSVDLEIQPVVEEVSAGVAEATGATTRIRVKLGEIVAVGATAEERATSGLTVPMEAHRTQEMSHGMILVRVQELSAGE